MYTKNIILDLTLGNCCITISQDEKNKSIEIEIPHPKDYDDEVTIVIWNADPFGKGPLKLLLSDIVNKGLKERRQKPYESSDF